MAVAPKFAAHVLGSVAHPVHTLELYLDYVCPYSAKLFKRVYNDVKPIIDSKFPNKVQIIFRQQVQPWHPSSTLTHEAALAVEQVDPSSFWKYSAAIFKNQVDFFDVNVVNETRNATYKRLSALATPLGVDEQKIYKLLAVADKPVDGAYNSGNQVTNDLKLHVKAARLVGVHVSPTVIFDGIVDNSISSGWDVAQWEEWLVKNVV
ncbi:thioredoxin-like protein [Tuber brumale]|nr:thioredoxin-like protein [Tuber brumale]